MEESISFTNSSQISSAGSIWAAKRRGAFILY
jgi:hypothetical protein